MTTASNGYIYLVKANGNYIDIKTSLFRAAEEVGALDSFAVVALTSHATHFLGAKSDGAFAVLAENSNAVVTLFGSAVSPWAIVDTQSVACMEADAHSDTSFSVSSGVAKLADMMLEGFIPYGETEIMLDANGDQFIVFTASDL